MICANIQSLLMAQRGTSNWDKNCHMPAKYGKWEKKILVSAIQHLPLPVTSTTSGENPTPGSFATVCYLPLSV